MGESSKIASTNTTSQEQPKPRIQSGPEHTGTLIVHLATKEGEIVTHTTPSLFDTVERSNARDGQTQ